MRGLKRLRSARILAAGHALVQNLRRGHYEVAVDQTEEAVCVPLSTSSCLLSDKALLRSGNRYRSELDLVVAVA